MGHFPQLQEEDFLQIQSALAQLLAKSEAGTVMLVEKAGYLIAECGETRRFNTTQLATLASNAFNATQVMTDRLGELNFSSMFQEGEQQSMLWMNVENDTLIVVVFPAKISVGAVKYYASQTAQQIASQLAIARARAPLDTFDPATLDPKDSAELFRRKK
jgi:predicted regulator of Ras-like GTPase activity (Roadblock/LC7/MglB family)